jgi:hypothetical protein
MQFPEVVKIMQIMHFMIKLVTFSIETRLKSNSGFSMTIYRMAHKYLNGGCGI